MKIWVLPGFLGMLLSHWHCPSHYTPKALWLWWQVSFRICRSQSNWGGNLLAVLQWEVWNCGQKFTVPLKLRAIQWHLILGPSWKLRLKAFYQLTLMHSNLALVLGLILLSTLGFKSRYWQMATNPKGKEKTFLWWCQSCDNAKSFLSSYTMPQTMFESYCLFAERSQNHRITDLIGCWKMPLKII